MTDDRLSVDLARNSISRAGVSVRVTPRTAEVADVLIRNRGRVVSREDIEWAVLGEFEDATHRLMDVYICALRKALRPLDCRVVTHIKHGWELVEDDVPATVQEGRAFAEETTDSLALLAADLLVLARHFAGSARVVEEYAARFPHPSHDATVLEARDLAERIGRAHRVARRELDRRGVPQPPRPATLRVVGADADEAAP